MSEYRHIKGAAEIQAVLLRFPAEVEAKVVRQSLAAGQRLPRDAARAAAPVGKTGRLQKTIRVSTRKKGRDIVAALKVGNPKKGVFYAHMVMGGTRAHTIKAKKGVALTIGAGGGIKVLKSVVHPGARANDFMSAAVGQVPAGLDAVIARATVLTAQLNKEMGSAT